MKKVRFRAIPPKKLITIMLSAVTVVKSNSTELVVTAMSRLAPSFALLY